MLAHDAIALADGSDSIVRQAVATFTKESGAGNFYDITGSYGLAMFIKPALPST
jgi:hypothetical protein